MKHIKKLLEKMLVENELKLLENISQRTTIIKLLNKIEVDENDKT